MALKFLNKKGWHTGSLRNIENVWKAEQKHDAEQKKLEELRKQILEERERAEYHLLQEQAGLVPKQDRLEFLYDSGLAVGKSSSDSFKALETLPGPPETNSSSSAKPDSVPGALFEETRQSANDTWRKLHSDPLLMIRQREQEALARVKNNPVQMTIIRKSVGDSKHKKTINKDELQKSRESHKPGHGGHSSSKLLSRSKNVSSDGQSSDMENRKTKKRRHRHHSPRRDELQKSRESHKSGHGGHSSSKLLSRSKNVSSDGQSSDRENWKTKKKHHHDYTEHSPRGFSDQKIRKGDSKGTNPRSCEPNMAYRAEPASKKRHMSRLSEEERAARLREMVMDAELHEEQRWRRLKKAAEDDAKEAAMAEGKTMGGGKLDESLYGANKGGSSTIEESVRRRTHYLQGKADAIERNAFRR